MPESAAQVMSPQKPQIPSAAPRLFQVLTHGSAKPRSSKPSSHADRTGPEGAAPTGGRVVAGQASIASGAAGIIVGLVEALSTTFMPPALKALGIYAVYMAVVLVRPRGLFGNL
jgi:hypothetical protein